MDKRIFKNETKIPQVYYDIRMNPVVVKPGTEYVEDLTGVIDSVALVNAELERRKNQGNVDVMKHVRKTLALIRLTKNVDELEKFRNGETNQEILDGILLKEKELLNGNDGRSGSETKKGAGESA
jgi:hypothetical protein